MVPLPQHPTRAVCVCVFFGEEGPDSNRFGGAWSGSRGWLVVGGVGGVGGVGTARREATVLWAPPPSSRAPCLREGLVRESLYGSGTGPRAG